MTLHNPPLGGRARLTWAAHLFKAVTRRHHRELIPILGPLLTDDAVVFDVGAHAGQMATLFASLSPRGKVIAFEPGAYALSILRPMVRLKGKGRIAIEPIALGAQPGMLTLNTPIKRSGSLGFGLSHLGAAPESGRVFSHQVTVETIDRYVALNAIRRLDLIKADIEGWEMQMLLGARESLERLRPVVFLEVVDAYLARAGDSRSDLWRFMTGLGYRAFRLAPGLPAFERAADGDVVWIVDSRRP